MGLYRGTGKTLMGLYRDYIGGLGFKAQVCFILWCSRVKGSGSRGLGFGLCNVDIFSDKSPVPDRHALEPQPVSRDSSYSQSGCKYMYFM